MHEHAILSKTFNDDSRMSFESMIQRRNKKVKKYIYIRQESASWRFRRLAASFFVYAFSIWSGSNIPVYCEAEKDYHLSKNDYREDKTRFNFDRHDGNKIASQNKNDKLLHKKQLVHPELTTIFDVEPKNNKIIKYEVNYKLRLLQKGNKHRTDVPSVTPSHPPSSFPTAKPSISLSSRPTINPSRRPSEEPTVAPSANPTTMPTFFSSMRPTANPTSHPTLSPTIKPTSGPSIYPTTTPTLDHSIKPTLSLSLGPSAMPTMQLTANPSINSTFKPSDTRTHIPTVKATTSPSYILTSSTTAQYLSSAPTIWFSFPPTFATKAPTNTNPPFSAIPAFSMNDNDSLSPSISHSLSPTTKKFRSASPTIWFSFPPTFVTKPTNTNTPVGTRPVISDDDSKSLSPSTSRSLLPSQAQEPMQNITHEPSLIPSPLLYIGHHSPNIVIIYSSATPSLQPTTNQSSFPSIIPTILLSDKPTSSPSISFSPSSSHSWTPSSSMIPSDGPTKGHSSLPTSSKSPTKTPTGQPSISHLPSHFLSNYPSTISSELPTVSTTPTRSKKTPTQAGITVAQTLPVLPFTMNLMTESPTIDTEILLKVTQDHMTNSFLESIPEKLYFDRLSLNLVSNRRRRLQQASHFYNFDGQAFFNTDAEVEVEIVTNSTIRAFRGKKLIDFENSLRISDIDVLDSIVYTNELPTNNYGVNDWDEDEKKNIEVDTKTQEEDKRITLFIWGLIGTTCLSFIVLVVVSIRRRNDMWQALSLQDSLSSPSQAKSFNGNRYQFSFEKSIESKGSEETPSSKSGGQETGSLIYEIGSRANSLLFNNPKRVEKKWYEKESPKRAFKSGNANTSVFKNTEKKKHYAWCDDNSESMGVEVVDAYDGESNDYKRDRKSVV